MRKIGKSAVTSAASVCTSANSRNCQQTMMCKIIISMEIAVNEFQSDFCCQQVGGQPVLNRKHSDEK